MITYEWFKTLHDELIDDFYDECDEDLCAINFLVTPIILPVLLFMDIMLLPYQLCIFLVRLIRKRVNNHEKKR